jgi:hypothetical protein
VEVSSGSAGLYCHDDAAIALSLACFLIVPATFSGQGFSILRTHTPRLP